MLARVPVVATRVGSIDEAVVDGETGVLVPPEEPDALAAALRDVLADAEARRAMGERGRAAALERFAPGAAAAAFEALYRRALGR
jgi:glycosyltransferase involved in cell wall biosynthesis